MLSLKSDTEIVPERQEGVLARVGDEQESSVTWKGTSRDIGITRRKKKFSTVITTSTIKPRTVKPMYERNFQEGIEKCLDERESRRSSFQWRNLFEILVVKA